MLLRIYERLKKNHGPQRWWPVTRPGRIHPGYDGGPKTGKQRLEVCIGAILTQNTSWRNVEKAIAELNRNRAISIKKILSTPQQKLAQWIRSSGYYNEKAKKLKQFCSFLRKKHNGRLSGLFALDDDVLRRELLSVNGIGPETADSIILYAAEKPAFVIDAYTMRIFNRIGFKEKTYHEMQERFMRSLPKRTKLFQEYHALIVQHGKGICRPKPLCGECCLRNVCRYGKRAMRRA